MTIRRFFFIGFIAICPALFGQTPAGVKLKVESATAAAVTLSWTGAGSWKLERRSGGGAWTPVAGSDQEKATDSSVDAGATYDYRLTSGEASSNSVTVGPPPAGFTPVALLPMRRTDVTFVSFRQDCVGNRVTPYFPGK